MSCRFEKLSPVTLGTVQLGMPYGCVRPSEPPKTDETQRILDLAMAGGVACLDTARAYGDAEAVIGRWLTGRGRSVDDARPLIVSKLPRIDADRGSVGAFLHHQFAASCSALGVDYIDGYLVHVAADIRRREVVGALSELVDAGRIGAFGVSAYTAEDVERALDIPDIGIVQAPCSVFDRRLVSAGAVERCAARGIAFFARSVFLQGALLTDPAMLPPRLAKLGEPLRALRELARHAGLPVAAIAIASVLAEPGVCSAVIGVTSADELSENLAAARLDVPDDIISAARDIAHGLPADLFDPRGW